MQISVSATRKPSNPPHPNPERTKRRPDPVLKFRGLAASGSQHFRWSPSRRLRKQYTHHAPTATPPPTPTPPPKNPATTTQNHPQRTSPHVPRPPTATMPCVTTPCRQIPTRCPQAMAANQNVVLSNAGRHWAPRGQGLPMPPGPCGEPSAVRGVDDAHGRRS